MSDTGDIALRPCANPGNAFVLFIKHANLAEKIIPFIEISENDLVDIVVFHQRRD